MMKIPHVWMPMNTHIRVLRGIHIWVFRQHIINT